MEGEARWRWAWWIVEGDDGRGLGNDARMDLAVAWTREGRGNVDEMGRERRGGGEEREVGKWDIWKIAGWEAEETMRSIERERRGGDDWSGANMLGHVACGRLAAAADAV